MPRLVYLDAATRDLLQIARYIARESGNQEIALHYTRRIRAYCRTLAMPETSQRGTDRSHLVAGMRSAPFGNYVIFFRYEADRLEIVNILEGHRDIDTWFGTDE